MNEIILALPKILAGMVNILNLIAQGSKVADSDIGPLLDELDRLNALVDANYEEWVKNNPE